MIDEAATGLPFHAASARAVDLYCDGIEAFLAAQVDSCSRPLVACLISHEVLGGSRAQRDLLGARQGSCPMSHAAIAVLC
ncbi:MAG: hypothetical protein EBX90_07255 [Betaproteobacteria bacterium]|nr:hypothetical protein [Betaproteobacteria bacterium]